MIPNTDPTLRAEYYATQADPTELVPAYLDEYLDAATHYRDVIAWNDEGHPLVIDYARGRLVTADEWRTAGEFCGHRIVTKYTGLEHVSDTAAAATKRIHEAAADTAAAAHAAEVRREEEDARHPLPFGPWLKEQAHRDDSVGDVARDYIEGAAAGEHADDHRTPAAMEYAIDQIPGADPAPAFYEALHRAADEWRSAHP